MIMSDTDVVAVIEELREHVIDRVFVAMQNVQTAHNKIPYYQRHYWSLDYYNSNLYKDINKCFHDTIKTLSDENHWGGLGDK